MAPEGMVHALDQIRYLLGPSGRLIDIHPSGEPPVVEVRRGSLVQAVGPMRETDDFVEYHQAHAALARAVAAGLFAVERAGEFIFVTHAGSLEELQAFLAAEWKDAILDEDVIRRVRETWDSAAAAEKEVLLRERVLISRLRPTWDLSLNR